MYLLTPTGLEEKSNITVRFLKAKLQEYELLQKEIKLLLDESKSEIADVVKSIDVIE